MILEMLADMRIVEAADDASFLQLAPRADARQHKDMRRSDGTRAQDHLARRVDYVRFASAVAILHPRSGQCIIEHNPSHQRVGHNCQVGPQFCGIFEIGVIGT